MPAIGAQGHAMSRAGADIAVAARKFARSECGNIGLIFSLSLIPLMLFVGAGIDVGRWLHARTATISALDAAVLAGARTLQVNNTDPGAAIEVAKSYYATNTKNRLKLVNDTISFTPSDNNTTFRSNGNAYIETPFLALANIKSLPILNSNGTEFSQAVLSAGGKSDTSIEIAMMLDVTGSMVGYRLNDLKVAAKDLIGIVLATDKETSRVAIVPYANSINAGVYAEKVRGSVASGTCTKPGCTEFTFTNPFGKTRTNDVSTCVSERTGADAYTDASPTSAHVGLNYPGPSNKCLTNTITPLTKEKTVLDAEIDALEAGGSTGGHIGVAWGWYLLSPNWASVLPAGSAPAPYGTGKVNKIAILMTDGEYNSAYCNGVISQDSTLGSGNPQWHINCNAPNGDSFSQAEALCANMKKAGVTVFTVGFDIIDDQRARDLMAKCATDPGHAYKAANGDQLKQTFRDIALKISQLYLTH